jgi:hypothetical protein
VVLGTVVEDVGDALGDGVRVSETARAKSSMCVLVPNHDMERTRVIAQQADARRQRQCDERDVVGVGRGCTATVVAAGPWPSGIAAVPADPSGRRHSRAPITLALSSLSVTDKRYSHVCTLMNKAATRLPYA